MNLQLRLILASVARAMRATFHRELSWAPALSRRAHFASPQARMHALRQLLLERALIERAVGAPHLVSRPGCWHASDRHLAADRKNYSGGASGLPAPWFFRASATIRESFLKYRHFKK